MASHDCIGDMLTKIRNAIMAKSDSVDIFPSREKVEIIKILKNEGYIKNFKKSVENNKNFIKIYLKYDEKGKSVITGLLRISKPGRRIYKPHNEIPCLYNGIGTVIVSTSKGILTGKRAINEKVGGEILCAIW